MIRLLSVARTGTRFTKKVLDDAGVKYFHTHFWGKYNIPDYDGVVVIPTRDKETARPSWVMYCGSVPKTFDEVWAEMEHYAANNSDVYMLHVDDPEIRDAELKAISDAVGVELTADFSKKIGHGNP